MRRPKKHQKAGQKTNYELFSNNCRSNGAANVSASYDLNTNNKKFKATLPETAELQYLFKRFNHLYFDGKLKKTKIEYSNRMTCAGSYSPEENLIRISRKYHQIFPSDIEDTLKHEMIHIRHFYHDGKFKAEARRIGASLKAKSHPTLIRPPKFLYVCPGCGLEYPRQKRMTMYSCGECSANKSFDPRFKLKLVKPLRWLQNPT
jgi:SprT-like protein